MEIELNHPTFFEHTSAFPQSANPPLLVLSPRLQRQLHRGSTQTPCCCSSSSLKGKWGSLWMLCGCSSSLWVSSSRHRVDTWLDARSPACIRSSFGSQVARHFSLNYMTRGGQVCSPSLVLCLILVDPSCFFGSRSYAATESSVCSAPHILRNSGLGTQVG